MRFKPNLFRGIGGSVEETDPETIEFINLTIEVTANRRKQRRDQVYASLKLDAEVHALYETKGLAQKLNSKYNITMGVH